MKKVVRDVSILYLAFLIGLWGLLFFGGDQWWPATLVLFAPRWIVALPLLLLVPAMAILEYRLLPLFVLHLAVIAFPILGLCVPTSLGNGSIDSDENLRVLSCNLGGGEVRTYDLIAMIEREQPDVVLLQECEAKLADEIFDSLQWNVRREGLMAIGSPWPLGEPNVLARHEPYQHNVAALACDVEIARPKHATRNVSATSSTASVARIRVVNVHLPTPRLGLQEFLDNGIDGTKVMDEITGYRQRMSADITEQLLNDSQDLIVAGDFNMPVDSRIYRDHWTDFNNAFSSQGLGLGYTKQTRWHGIRIDHILSRDPWQPIWVAVRSSVGGDHCPQVAEFRRQP